MPTYEITAPDGRKFRVTGNGSQEEALAQVQARYTQQSQPRQFVGPPVPEQPKASLGDQLKRSAGLGARSIVEGAMGVVNPFADLTGAVLNLPIQAYDKLRAPKLSELVTGKQPSFRFPTNHAAEQSAMLTNAGLPTPQGGMERAADILTQLVVGSVASAPATSAVMGRLGLLPDSIPSVPQPTPAPSRAATEPARVLEDAGIPLDQAQRSGGRFMQMLRSAVSNHPFTADRAADFAGTQQKAFNRAVLRSIGENADEATQGVMASAYKRIGSVFNGIGKQGAAFDDTLQAEIASIVDDASRTIPDSAMGPVTRNVDDLLNSVDEAGKISGEQFVKIRSHLSELSDNADVGRIADRLENAMLGALERTHPGQKQVLQDAIDQWRTMRIVQTAIGKGAERDISPLRLANAIATRQNQAMSVYGMGGNQDLVRLAQAGKSVLPQALPDSGTIPRGLMQAPVRAIVTAPLYRAAQNYLYRAPLPAGGGVMRNALAPPAIGAANALIQAQ